MARMSEDILHLRAWRKLKSIDFIMFLKFQSSGVKEINWVSMVKLNYRSHDWEKKTSWSTTKKAVNVKNKTIYISKEKSSIQHKCRLIVDSNFYFLWFFFHFQRVQNNDKMQMNSLAITFILYCKRPNNVRWLIIMEW